MIYPIERNQLCKTSFIASLSNDLVKTKWWFCLLRKKGGRDMTSIEDFVPMKKTDLVTYAMRSNEKLFGEMAKATKGELSGTQYKEGSVDKEKKELE